MFLQKVRLLGQAKAAQVLFLLFVAAGFIMASPRKAALDGTFVATAYSTTGITASGEHTHRHVIAADPSILPIGTRIKVKRAGKYSGEYVVADTGRKIVGRRLDIYMPSSSACEKFGRKSVRVRVIQLGEGTHASAHEADQAVKKDVASDISKGTVGNAATEVDWTAKHPNASDQPAPKQPAE